MPVNGEAAMNREESLSHVERLLTTLPGVEIAWKHKERFLMEISSQESLACLATISFAANVTLVVETDWRSFKAGSTWDPKSIRYEFQFPVESESINPPSRIQVVGILLARELKERGLLPADEADSLQKAWNAAPM
jgi:hypothetical protein